MVACLKPLEEVYAPPAPELKGRKQEEEHHAVVTLRCEALTKNADDATHTARR